MNSKWIINKKTLRKYWDDIGLVDYWVYVDEDKHQVGSINISNLSIVSIVALIYSDDDNTILSIDKDVFNELIDRITNSNIIQAYESK